MLQYQHTTELSALISSLEQAVATDKIFLLGQSVDGLLVNSIFRPFPHFNKPATGHFLLLLTRPGEQRTDDVIQDMLEARNRYRVPIHMMVYPAKSFYHWLQTGQIFALKVIEEAPMLYNAGIISIPDITHMKPNIEMPVAQAKLGLQRSAAFMAGAALFIRRSQFNLAAFLLHQATEHACLSYLLYHTGLRTGTHNLDKLLRYSTMISNTLIKIFPRETTEDIELFRLLQKAYIHSRYKDDYCISEKQIRTLASRIKKLIRKVNADLETPLPHMETNTAC